MNRKNSYWYKTLVKNGLSDQIDINVQESGLYFLQMHVIINHNLCKFGKTQLAWNWDIVEILIFHYTVYIIFGKFLNLFSKYK